MSECELPESKSALARDRKLPAAVISEGKSIITYKYPYMHNI